jgi:hypothetical protein
MGEMERFPTTDQYKLGVNVDTSSLLLKQHFQDAVAGKPSKVGTPELIKSLVGRDDVKVIDANNSISGYAFKKDELYLNPSELTLVKLLHVAADNLPPNIPHELAPELLSHLMELHEAEHVTQYSFLKGQNTGMVITDSLRSTITGGSVDAEDLKLHIVAELDADLPVLKHLRDMGLDNVAQFWEDARTNVSYVDSFMSLGKEITWHDTSSLNSYYEETGKLIDLDSYISARKSLTLEIMDKMHFSEDEVKRIKADYPNLKENEKVIALNSSAEGKASVSVRPQGLLYAVQSLLEKGELKGLQKWDAENYVKAMDRLGYTADPNYTYEAHMRDVIENKLGIEPLSKNSIDAVEETHSQNIGIGAGVGQ